MWRFAPAEAFFRAVSPQCFCSRELQFARPLKYRGLKSAPTSNQTNTCRFLNDYKTTFAQTHTIAGRGGQHQQRQLKVEILKFKVNTITKQPLPQHALSQDGAGSINNGN